VIGRINVLYPLDKDTRIDGAIFQKHNSFAIFLLLAFFCFLPFSDEHFIDQINAAFKLERSKVL